MKTFVPREYGGRGALPKEIIKLLEVTAYESLPLSLFIGINGALFLEPLAKNGNEEQKERIFKDFVENKKLGGLMITEPGHGTDALNMRTSFREKDGTYQIIGTKHWQGLTGLADYWIVTGRRQKADGLLDRDIDFFLTDSSDPEQKIVVEEYFENLGLYMIPYGINQLNIEVPKSNYIDKSTKGIYTLMDMLHRSRMRFTGMAMGFLRRIFDDTLDHCRRRFVSGRFLEDFDQVQARLAQLQAWVTASTAMCRVAVLRSGFQKNLIKEGLTANVQKSILSEMMQAAAQSFQQLMGAAGYKQNHRAGSAITDSRPFQIFEGSNDVMFHQISEAVLKEMKKIKETNLLRFLRNFSPTQEAVEHVKSQVDFSIEGELPQRKKVRLGNALGQIISMQWIIDLGEKGYKSDLISQALEVFTASAKTLISQFHHSSNVRVAEAGPSWEKFL